MKITVYGASSDEIKKIYLEEVEILGEKMAKRGHSVVFGAGDGGCMGAVARGAHKAGGEIIGVIPTFFNVDGVISPHCTEIIKTVTMRDRKEILEDEAGAFIVTPGGIGTFDEFFEIITLKQLQRHKKAIAIYNVDGYFDMLHDMLKKLVDEGFMREASARLVEFFTDADEMLDYIENYNPEDLDIEELKHLITGEDE